MNCIDNHMNIKFDAEYCITENLLLDYENWKLAPLINENFIDYIGIFETNVNKTNSFSMGEMMTNGVNPFEDLSDLYDLEEK